MTCNEHCFSKSIYCGSKHSTSRRKSEIEELKGYRDGTPTRPTEADGGRGSPRAKSTRRPARAGRQPPGLHALPVPEAGRRKSSLAEGRSPRCAPGSRLAMAMGGGGGGGSGSGFPEPEDSVLFRRGTGEVRLRPRCRRPAPALLPRPVRSLPPHVSTSFPTWEPQPQAPSSSSLGSFMTLSAAAA